MEVIQAVLQDYQVVLEMLIEPSVFWDIMDFGGVQRRKTNKEPLIDPSYILTIYYRRAVHPKTMVFLFAV